MSSWYWLRSYSKDYRRETWDESCIIREFAAFLSEALHGLVSGTMAVWYRSQSTAFGVSDLAF